MFCGKCRKDIDREPFSAKQLCPSCSKYEWGEDKELDKLRTDRNISKVLQKAKQIGNKSLLRKKK